MPMTLKNDLQSIIDASGAHMGVAVHHLESGQRVEIDADQAFPLCSVVKVPILVEAFRQMAAGKFGLADRWTLTLEEKNLPSGVLVFFEDGLTPTVRDLLTLMIIVSDNTATDMVLQRVGTETVNDLVHGLGMTDTHVVMTIRDIFDDMLPSADARQVLENVDKPVSLPINRDGRAYSLSADNNVGTPRDMNLLLEHIYRGQVVDRDACDAMLHILLQQQLNQRIPRFLPAGTPVAHKTGTLSGVQNDAGIIYVHEDSHVAVTTYSTWDAKSVSDDPIAIWEHTTAIDNAMGYIGRLVYDFFS